MNLDANANLRRQQMTQIAQWMRYRPVHPLPFKAILSQPRHVACNSHLVSQWHYTRCVNRRVPQNLQRVVREFYDYLWSCHQTLNQEDLVKDLPQSLQIRLSIALNRDLIRKVSSERGRLQLPFKAQRAQRI